MLTTCPTSEGERLAEFESNLATLGEDQRSVFFLAIAKLLGEYMHLASISEFGKTCLTIERRHGKIVSADIDARVHFSLQQASKS